MYTYDTIGAQRVQEQAARWTQKQADRLGVTPAEIRDATARGWFSEFINALPASDAARLSGPPVALRSVSVPIRT